MSPSDFLGIGRYAGSATSRLTVKSALNPMLWLSGITALCCLPAAYFFRDQPVICYSLAFTPIIVILGTLALGVYFSIFKTEKLQSEEYQIRKEALQLVFQKGKFTVEQVPVIQSIVNPERQLTEGNPSAPAQGH
jgi:hypothetical protein